MFDQARAFNQVISKWDVSSGTTFVSALGCLNLVDGVVFMS